MVELQNGMNLSGQKELSMWVSESRLNGKLLFYVFATLLVFTYLAAEG